MKKKLLFISIIMYGFMVNINPVLADFSTDKVIQVCGFNYMPDRLPGFTSGLYTILKILVPIILIVMGILDFTKATMASKEDDMKKSQKRFITRLIAGVMVFFIMSIVQFVFKKIDNSSAFTNCMNCILSNSGCGASNLMEPNTVCDNRSLETCNGTDKYGSTCVQVNTGSKPICRSQCSSITDTNRCNAKSYCIWLGTVCGNKGTTSYNISSTNSGSSSTSNSTSSKNVKCSKRGTDTCTNPKTDSTGATCEATKNGKCRAKCSSTKKKKACGKGAYTHCKWKSKKCKNK